MVCSMTYLFALFNEHVLVSNKIHSFYQGFNYPLSSSSCCKDPNSPWRFVSCIYLKLRGTFSLSNASQSNMLFHCLQGTFRLMTGSFILIPQVGGVSFGTIGDMPFSFLNTTPRVKTVGYVRIQQEYICFQLFNKRN